MSRVSELSPDHNDWAIHIIEEWGYPREFTGGDYSAQFLELDHGDGFVWFEPLGDEHPLFMAVHIAICPDMRGRTFTWNAWVKILAFAIDEGWLRLYVLNADEKMVGYAKRIGFEQEVNIPEWLFYPLSEAQNDH